MLIKITLFCVRKEATISNVSVNMLLWCLQNVKLWLYYRVMLFNGKSVDSTHFLVGDIGDTTSNSFFEDNKTLVKCLAIKSATCVYFDIARDLNIK